MKGLNTQKLAAYFFVVVSIFLFSSFSSCDEIIDKARQAVPKAGDKYNAAEEMRRAQGTSDKIRPYAPKGANTPTKVGKGCYYSLSWHSALNASLYCVNWSFYNNNNEKKKEGTSDWIDKYEYGWNVPDEEGIMYVNVYSKNSAGQSKEPLSYIVTISKKGKLIFLTHGLNDNIGACFQETVIILLGYDNYRHYGRVSASYVRKNENKSQYINQLIDEGKNVLVNLEFSEGNLSFAKQLEEMRKMVAIFHGHNASNVVFVGHSMGGLAGINYGVEYADTYKGKKIKIITVSTPFSANNYAIFEHFRNWGRITGAQWDLAGFSIALPNLKSKWIEYKRNIGSIELHTIGIIGSSNNVKDRNNRGDCIIDVDTQLGADWGIISSQYTITRNNNNSEKIDVWDTKDPYHHCNTDNLPQVAKRIKEIVEK